VHVSVVLVRAARHSAQASGLSNPEAMMHVAMEACSSSHEVPPLLPPSEGGPADGAVSVQSKEQLWLPEVVRQVRYVRSSESHPLQSQLAKPVQVSSSISLHDETGGSGQNVVTQSSHTFPPLVGSTQSLKAWYSSGHGLVRVGAGDDVGLVAGTSHTTSHSDKHAM